jgi:cardiolipin synthase A/B
VKLGKLPERSGRAALELRGERAPVPLHRRLAWPAAIAATLLARYATESLRHRRDGRVGYAVKDPAPPSSEDFRWAAEALTGHVTVGGNHVEVLVNGDNIFPSVLEAVRGAKETLNVETYVYWQGGIAEQLAEAICDRARAGVECRVLLDAVGSAKMSPSQIRAMREAGARVVRFRPPLPHLIRRADNRSHRRVIVVDGRVGFTGGVGIAAEWEGNAEDPDHWRDTHFKVEGPIVHALQGAFGEHWVEATGEALVGEHFLPKTEPFDDGVPAQLVRSGARVGDTTIETLYFLAIASAEESIELTAAYFAPRPPFVEALCDASNRGVSVRVLVPGPHTDKQFVRVAGRAVYSQLLDCGVEVFEYQRTMLHAKSMVVDGCWASVGTANFDNRSFQLNDELTLCVFDKGIASEMSDVFADDLEQSERVDPQRFANRSPVHKAREALTVPLRREL